MTAQGGRGRQAPGPLHWLLSSPALEDTDFTDSHRQRVLSFLRLTLGMAPILPSPSSEYGHGVQPHAPLPWASSDKADGQRRRRTYLLPVSTHGQEEVTTYIRGPKPRVPKDTDSHSLSHFLMHTGQLQGQDSPRYLCMLCVDRRTSSDTLSNAHRNTQTHKYTG